MVNKPLIRPAISGGGTWPGWRRLTSHATDRIRMIEDGRRRFRKLTFNPGWWFDRDFECSAPNPCLDVPGS